MSKIAEKKIQCQNSIWCTLKKATTKNSEWPDKVRMNTIATITFSFRTVFVFVTIDIKLFIQDEFLDVIYWARQIIGLIAGLLWGLLPLKGLFGLGL